MARTEDNFNKWERRREQKTGATSTNGNAQNRGGPASPPKLSQKELIAKFIARVDRLERRYEGDKFADMWLVPKDELIAVRDSIVRPGLFDSVKAAEEVNKTNAV